MEVSRRRTGTKGSAVAGSVWENRMKSDEVKGGVKVFNAEENGEEGGNIGNGNKLKRSQIGGNVTVTSGKRKSWKSESSEGIEKTPIKVPKGKSEPQKNCEKQCKELSISCDGVKKSPVQLRKLKNENGASATEKFERSPIQTRKLRSDTTKGAAESGEVPEKNSGQLRKSKSDSVKTSIQCGKNSIKLELDQASDELRNVIEKITVKDEKKNDPDENCKDFGVCEEEKVISDDLGVVKCSPDDDGGDSDAAIDDHEEEEGDERDEEEEEVADEEIEVEMENEKEKESYDVKEITIPESKVVKEPEIEKVVNEPEKKVIMNEPEKKKVVVNEAETKKVVVNEAERKKVVVNKAEPVKVVSAHQRFHLNNERPVSVPLTVKQSPPIRRHSTIYQNFSKPNPIPKAAEEYQTFPQTQNKLQSLVDLIMWRDVSRSTFVFGIGTFIIVSSSYAKDINLSLISVFSYVGLVYLAATFLYRSLICRGVIDVEDTSYVLGEEEAIWVLKLVLPYLNEFLSKLRALFSGDPGTTIKLAVLLFVLARCGSSITIWKMAKFGFFGVFIVPKICSSYSAQLTAYANFWIRRFRDAWDSCTHKKAVALGIFGLVWNLSSVVARTWAVFVLFVAFRYYQQHYLVRDEWEEDEAEAEEQAGCDETWQEPVTRVGGQKQGQVPNFVEINKVKKGF